jgi:hypothetical protein
MTDITCKQCGKVGTISDHFTYKTKAGMRPYPKCRKCHNAGKYIKKLTGWVRLSPDVQTAIRSKLEHFTINEIAAEFDLNSGNLKRWILKGDHLRS